ncbi:hypothetical protein GCM10011374_02040 [Kocuria dechangensis]|uniref:SLH domain-containing protein n=1 Tax=Kocuria dechangensis TaxID=1176249 RepID=A0A917LMM5_9MICC|nr:S-layer homology domain-containing protein [Kocuria dechangensis]GGG43268.1 hypothetical protein GCM10011374_02040 [Kocuria dechangensis]
MQKHLSVAALTGALLVTGLGVTTAPATAASSDIVTVSPSTRLTDTQQLLELINAHRRTKGLAPVKYSATLSQIAQGQSDRLVREEVIDHTDTFMTDPRAGSWNAVGEIHAVSWQVSVHDLMNWWKGSTAHNKVLTDPRMQVIGIGLTYADGSLAGDGDPWRLAGTVASYGYPDGMAPTDARESVTTAPSGSTAPSAPSAPSVTPVGPFVDVPAHHQFAAEVSWVKQRGLLNGWRDGTFRPGLPIERGAMAAVAYRMAGSPGYTAPADSAYRDVAPGDPFYKEIHWAKAQGLLNGWRDGTFRPTTPIARDATAALLYRTAGSPYYSAPATSSFSDLAPGNQFYKEIHWLQASGITTGWKDGTFRPRASTNRDAMSAFLHRFSSR